MPSDERLYLLATFIRLLFGVPAIVPDTPIPKPLPEYSALFAKSAKVSVPVANEFLPFCSAFAVDVISPPVKSVWFLMWI